MSKKSVYVVIAILLVITASLLIFVYYFIDPAIASSLKWAVGAIMAYVTVISFKSISQIVKLQNFILNSSVVAFIKKSLEDSERLNQYFIARVMQLSVNVLTHFGYSIDESKEPGRDESKDHARQTTVVNLFLLNEKKKLLKGKLAGLFIVLISLGCIVYMDASLWFLVPGVLTFSLNSIKEEILSYRIRKGFFGRNMDEALQLIKFIHDNIDDINNDGNDGDRKILNDKEQIIKDFVLGWKGEQNA